MTTISSDKAEENLSDLIGRVSLSHEPIEIHAAGGTAVLISEDDWRAIQETLHLVSVPGTRESIREGMATAIDECSEEPGW
jgi:prevent-host-death family protein